MTRLCFLILLLISVYTYPQTKTDSILHKLPDMEDDSLKVKAYFDLFWDNYRRNHDSALIYADKAISLTDKLNLQFEQADALRVKSFALTGLGRMEEAMEVLEKSLRIFSKLEENDMIADVKKEIGFLYKLQSNYPLAIEYLLEALTLAVETKNKNSEAQILNYIAGIHKEQKQYNKALDYYNEALDIVEELQINAGISACLTNLAAVYTNLGDLEKALEMNERSLDLKIQMEDVLGEGRVLVNLGSLNYKLKKFTKAKEHFTEALILAGKVGDKKMRSEAIYGLAQSAYGQDNYEDSIDLANSLLNEFDPYEDLELSIALNKLLYKAYGKLGNYNLAFEKGISCQTLSDSLYSQNMLIVTNDLEAKYQNEQKNSEIALLASEKELQTLQLAQRRNERNVIIVFAIMILLLAVLIYNQYRIKQRSNLELKELDELKSNFFANISHEFRTPLTLIKGPIDRLDQDPDEHLEKEEIKMIRRNTNKVLDLVNQLLELSRIDKGKLQLKPTEGDIFKCLRTAVSSFNSHAAQRQMDYLVDIPNEILWAAFDRNKLEKIVYNLLSNAFKFSDDREQVIFRTKYQNDVLEIQVSDSGKGISRDKLPFIFDRFYQVDGSLTKSTQGSGIGLSLSKNLVELMNGTITVTSEEGKGTFFLVQLPIEKIEIRQREAAIGQINSNSSSVPAMPFELNKTDSRDLPQVLLVEDNVDMRQFIRTQLIDEYKVIEANNGDKGISKAKAIMPDLIITDLMMPKIDGIELCKQLKTSIETSHIPIIMLTARAGVENKIEGLETGADDYLTKPFNKEELSVRVNNLIEQRKRLREHFSNHNRTVYPAKITTTSLDSKFLEKVLVLLEKEHSNPNFGVPQMQESMAMSNTQLHRKLKALTNESPGELIRNFRLKRASQLLSQQADTVTQIAYQVGFNNLSYFAKCFKDLYGVSPSSY